MGQVGFNFPTKILYAILISLIRATYPVHLAILDLLVLIRLDKIEFTRLLTQLSYWTVCSLDV